MKDRELKPVNTALTGTIDVPGDKSISHRSIMFASLAKGTTVIRNFLEGEDCLRTIAVFREMGVSIEKAGTAITVHGKGKEALAEPAVPLYFGNSGTTARLMMGILSGLPFFTSVYGDPSLTSRPMNRVTDPLKQMGAKITGRKNGGYLPLAVSGGILTGIQYELPVKSAQVKSAVLLAGLQAKGITEVAELTPTRNHTENMLQAFGADITQSNGVITIKGEQELTAADVYVPGDISSAAFFIAGAAIKKDSSITIQNVGLNQTRTGILECMKQMGAQVHVSNEQLSGGEQIGDITVAYSCLNGVTIEGEIIPSLIDEIPIIALLATQAEGTTVIRDAAELKLKETDRIEAVADVLCSLGAKIEPTEDGMIIHGKTQLHGGRVKSYNDHRIAMMIAIASLVASEEIIIDDDACIAISYPEFFRDLHKLTH